MIAAISRAACAAIARAEFRVTGERGLLELATHQDVISISADQASGRKTVKDSSA